jgi:hypothetical protein
MHTLQSHPKTAMPKCFLVAHIDATKSPPVMKCLGLYSESALCLTSVDRNRNWMVDVWEVEGATYQAAADEMRRQLRANQTPLPRMDSIRAMAADVIGDR